MAEDLDRAEESSGVNRDGGNEADPNLEEKRLENTPADAGPNVESSPPPPTLPSRRGIRESREPRDERVSDRPPRRDQYDRNRSSPPPPLKDRDYHKRSRLSSSPPPPLYRDRRPNSPGRRSPSFHPYKRRKDDVYDGRRGNTRGEYGLSDRRFPYDYPAGYDREMGGRIGNPDNRLYGRLGRGYPSGASDWDSGRAGFTDSFNSGGAQRDGMMSYKQFIQELEDDIGPAEAEKRYQEYRSEYISTQKRSYFSAHKDEEWLKDKYHPTNLLAVIERRNDLSKKLSKDFQVDLQNGKLDIGPGYIASSSKAEQLPEPNSDDEADFGAKRKRPGRGGAKESDHISPPKAHPVFSESRRIQIDIEQALSLVRKLDVEKGIEDNILLQGDSNRLRRDKGHGNFSGPVIIVQGLNAVKGLEGVELLETLLTYLWRIHGIDYYGLAEKSEAKGLRYVRADGKTTDKNSVGDEMEKKLDFFWHERLNRLDPLVVMTAKEKIDAATADSLDPHVRKIRDEKYGWKYGCGAKGCTKLFHASEFVQKHLKLKHPELVMELTSKVHEELYFQNYMGDDNAPGGKPIILPSFLKDDRFRQRRPGLEGRLVDERGNHREYDNRLNGNELFDRSENTSGNNPDEGLYDSFGGQNIATFPLDMTPPVLMPVPGAGPLGPFVPAPPEVAMQMLRDGPGGRNGRSGSGPSPIISMPRQDPRRLRSYNDLDAPDDEVTVIDYRSL